MNVLLASPPKADYNYFLVTSASMVSGLLVFVSAIIERRSQLDQGEPDHVLHLFIILLACCYAYLTRSSVADTDIPAGSSASHAARHPGTCTTLFISFDCLIFRMCCSATRRRRRRRRRSFVWRCVLFLLCSLRWLVLTTASADDLAQAAFEASLNYEPSKRRLGAIHRSRRASLR